MKNNFKIESGRNNQKKHNKIKANQKRKEQLKKNNYVNEESKGSCKIADNSIKEPDKTSNGDYQISKHISLSRATVKDIIRYVLNKSID